MPRSSHHGRSLLAGGALAAVAGVVAAAAVTGSGPATGGSGSGAADLGRIAPAGFSSFTSCDDLLAYFRTNGRRLVTAYGLPGQVGFAYDAAGRVAEGAPAMAPGAVGAGSGGAAPAPAGGDFSKSTTSATGTNVQVAGVDEADLLKVDGDRLLTLTDGTLRVLRIEKDRVRLLGSLRLANWAPQSMLVDSDRLLLLGGWIRFAMPMAEGGVATGKAVPGGSSGIAPGENGVQLPDPPQGRMTSRLAEVSLADSSAPKVVRVLDVDGVVAGARMVDGVVRLAVTSTGGSRIAWTYPQAAGDETRALAANRTRVTRSTIADWLPAYSVVDVAADGSPRGAAQTGRLLDCGDVAAPTTFSGLDLLSLLTLDLHGKGPGLSRWNGTGVVATGSTMYATADHTYVATSPWQNWAVMSPQVMREAIGRQTTQIHLFDTADTGAPLYVASGDVPGFLIGQFAMDEYQGRLRVASTTQPSFGMPIPVDVAPNTAVSSDGVASADASEGVAAPDEVATGKVVPPVKETPSTSQVTVLSVKGTKLVTTGSVTGLGRGETIRAVRFIGPLGYVVTYRQTDPLYVIDLRNPARPTVRGELKILGYSAYLHPVGWDPLESTCRHASLSIL